MLVYNITFFIHWDSSFKLYASFERVCFIFFFLIFIYLLKNILIFKFNFLFSNDLSKWKPLRVFIYIYKFKRRKKTTFKCSKFAFQLLFCTNTFIPAVLKIPQKNNLVFVDLFHIFYKRNIVSSMYYNWDLNFSTTVSRSLDFIRHMFTKLLIIIIRKSTKEHLYTLNIWKNMKRAVNEIKSKINIENHN